MELILHRIPSDALSSLPSAYFESQEQDYLWDLLLE